ncbi:hypothetical protein NKH77_27525 [Streptomyces sp. M19]
MHLAVLGPPGQYGVLQLQEFLAGEFLARRITSLAFASSEKPSTTRSVIGSSCPAALPPSGSAVLRPCGLAALRSVYAPGVPPASPAGCDEARRAVGDGERTTRGVGEVPWRTRRSAPSWNGSAPRSPRCAREPPSATGPRRPPRRAGGAPGGADAGGAGRGAAVDRGRTRRADRPVRRRLGPGVWGARTTTDTDRWVATVGPLPRQPAVGRAVATYLSGEIVSTVDVRRRLADGLPPRSRSSPRPSPGSSPASCGTWSRRGWPTTASRRCGGTPTGSRTNGSWPWPRATAEPYGSGTTRSPSTCCRSSTTSSPRCNGSRPPSSTGGRGCPRSPRDGSRRICGTGSRRPSGCPCPRTSGGSPVRRRPGRRPPPAHAAGAPARGGRSGRRHRAVRGGRAAGLPDRRRTVLQLGVWLVVWTAVLSGVLRHVRGNSSAPYRGRVPDGPAPRCTPCSPPARPRRRAGVAGRHARRGGVPRGPRAAADGAAPVGRRGARTTGRYTVTTARRLGDATAFAPAPLRLLHRLRRVDPPVGRRAARGRGPGGRTGGAAAVLLDRPARRRGHAGGVRDGGHADRADGRRTAGHRHVTGPRHPGRGATLPPAVHPPQVRTGGRGAHTDASPRPGPGRPGQPRSGDPHERHDPAALPPQPVIHEVNTWVWLRELSPRPDAPLPLGDVPEDAWDAVAPPGVDAVWLMGVWERSPRAGPSRSPTPTCAPPSRGSCRT